MVHATITSQNNEEIMVWIIDSRINAALHFNNGNPSLATQLTNAERRTTFLGIPGQVNTFKDLVCKEIKAPLQVHMQHFTTGKQHRHTLPSVRLAHLFTKAYTSGVYQYINYGNLVLDLLISYAKTKGILTAPFIYNGLILTRIAYHAIGMIDDLPPPLTQRYELKRALSPRGSTKTTKFAPKKRSIRHKLVLPKDSDDEEGTSRRVPLPQASQKIPEILPEDPSENVIPKSREVVELQERSDYSALKKIQKERAKRLREEEGLSEEDEKDLEKDKLIHRDKRTKPKEDPKIVKMRQERL